MKKFSIFAFALCVLGIIAATSSVNTLAGETVSYTEEDYNVIPDKYNTGVDEHDCFTKVEPGIYNGVKFSVSGDSSIALSFRKNVGLSERIEFNNLDFSEYWLRIYDEKYQTEPLTLVFNNCKFYKFRSFENGNSSVNFEFNNCSFVQCVTSNSILNKCYFGGGIIDGLVPYNNVYVNDCFFADKCMQNFTDTTGVHTDGTQIYGSKTFGCSNIHYENCRFEMPILKNAANAVNACIMLQIEFADATDITFNNCITNGGGYPIYARACKEGTISNSSITNVKVGCANKWSGFVYPHISPEIVLDNIVSADTLYVGSVWKDSGVIHLSVTNDTNDSRKLLVKTSNGDAVVDVPACYKYNELPDYISYNDFPFDMDVIVQDADWVVCYDVTNDEERQIRFVNFTNDTVVLYADYDDTYAAYDESFGLDGNNNAEYDAQVYENVLASGTCGKAVTWTLVEEGILYVDGYGEMDNYNSKKVAPWNVYINDINTVVVADGVKTIGSQAFKYCRSLVSVVLPESVEVLGSNAFAGCKLLTSIELPSSISSIGSYCFNGVRFEGVIWNGNSSVGKKNGNLESFR